MPPHSPIARPGARLSNPATPAPSLRSYAAAQVLAMRAPDGWSEADWYDATCWTSRAQADRELSRLEAAGAVAKTTRGLYSESAGIGCPAKRKRGAPRPRPWTESGTWRRATAAERSAGIEATGPITVLWDSEGRRYAARYALVVLGSVLVSHTADGRAVPDYPTQLQARDRAGALSRAQVEAIATGLQPDRLLAPSSSPADGAPVAWLDDTAELGPRGRVIALAGNGRLAAMRYAFRDSGVLSGYEARVRARWPVARVSKTIVDTDADLVVVRLVDASALEAVQLAAASQTAATGELGPVARARTVARSSSVSSPLQFGRFRWTAALNGQSFQRFQRENARWWGDYLHTLDPARRASANDGTTGARLVNDLLIGTLPADVDDALWTSSGLGEALRGALPAIWTLHGAVNDGDVKPQWDLLPQVPRALGWARQAGSATIARLQRDVGDAEDQADLFPPEEVSALGYDRLAVALGVALVRASRRANPADAAAGYVFQYVQKAEVEGNARQGGLIFGRAEHDRAEQIARDSAWRTLARIVRFTFTRDENRRRRGSYMIVGWAVGVELAGGESLSLPGYVIVVSRWGGPPRLALLEDGDVGEARAESRAARMWREWSSDRATWSAGVELYHGDPVEQVIGDVATILYTTQRDGRTVDYFHDFEATGLPQLVETRGGGYALDLRHSAATVSVDGIEG